MDSAIDQSGKWAVATQSRPEGPPLTDEQTYRELFENANDVVYTHDLQGNFTSVNKAIQRITGFSRAEALKLKIQDLLVPQSADTAQRMLTKMLGGAPRVTYEVNFRTKDGRAVAFEVSSRLLFRQGQPAGVLGIARDVSQRRRSEAHLHLLNSVVVNANDAVLIAEVQPGDSLGARIVYVNEAFTRMTGYVAEDAIGRTMRILLGPRTERERLDEVRRALANLAPVRIEMVNYRQDGSEFWVDANFVPIIDDDGEFRRWMAVQRDITSRKRAEELERDRNRALEMMANNEPLEKLLGHLVEMVERQHPDLRCSVMLTDDGQSFAGEPEAAASAGAGGVRTAGKPAPTHGTIEILAGNGSSLGCFKVQCKTPRALNEDELDLVKKAGRLAAIAIEQRQLTERLAHQARHDALTGLPNRFLFEDRLQQALARARRHGTLTAVLFVDLDRFKQINDTLGHAAGDALLQQVAHRLSLCIRETDTLARMGGDEFTVLLGDLRETRYALVVAQKLLDELKSPFSVEEYELFVTASVGISLFPRDGRDSATLQRNADSAMYRAKNQGRNRYQCFVPEIGETAQESLEIETALRKAVENGELLIQYQPQIDHLGRVVGLEALLGWHHPRLGMISPTQFIPVAEETGLIFPIGGWVLEHACRQSVAWQKAGYEGVKMAVNVSAVQFNRAGFVDTVAETLERTGLDPSMLELELTESVVMRDVRESSRQMQGLRTLGVSLSIDDFGTRYSSLSYLRRLPIDTLKIDQSFLREMDGEPSTMPLVKAIVALAHSLSLSVVAEGVETERQLGALRRVGCDRFQGFLLGQPMPAGPAERWLQSTTDALASLPRIGPGRESDRTSVATSIESLFVPLTPAAAS